MPKTDSTDALPHQKSPHENCSFTFGDDNTFSHPSGTRRVRAMDPRENATSLEVDAAFAATIYICEEDASYQSLQSTNCHRYPQERPILECGPCDPRINATNPYL